MQKKYSANISTLFREDVQGIRAIAVLAVMIFHANQSWLPAGFLGVDIFFVISGYVVSLSVLNSNKQFSWSQFYIGRVKRIVPAYFTLLIITTIIACILLIPDDFTWYKQSLKSALYFNSNHYFKNFGSYFAPNANELPLLHTWSLAIEMQFYFLLPILLIFIPRKYISHLCLLILLGLLITSELIIQKTSQNIYFSLWARIPEFLFGVLLALHNEKIAFKKITSNILATLGVTLIFVAFWTISSQNYPGFQIILPCVGASLLILSKNSMLNQILAAPIFTLIGVLSYSLYLWHWPILAFIRYYTESYTLTLPLLFTYVLLAMLLSILSYQLIEKPIRQSSTKIAMHQVAIITLTLFLTVIFSKQFNQHYTKPLPIEQTRYADDTSICHGKILYSCHRGAQKELADVLVIGDSHTAQLNYFYDYIGSKTNTTFNVISGSSCIPIEGFNIKKLPTWAQEPCKKQIEKVSHELSKYNTIILGAYWKWQFEDNHTLLAVENFIANQHKHGKKIILMAQLPVYENNLHRQIRFGQINLPTKTQQNSDWQHANNRLRNMSETYGNVELFDISHSDFFNTPFINGQPIYYDQSHLNEVGTKIYAEHAYPQLIRILDTDNSAPIL